MNKEEEVKFIKEWLRGLDLLFPEVRGCVNQLAHIWGDKYISIDREGNVTIERFPVKDGK